MDFVCSLIYFVCLLVCLFVCLFVCLCGSAVVVDRKWTLFICFVCLVRSFVRFAVVVVVVLFCLLLFFSAHSLQ